MANTKKKKSKLLAKKVKFSKIQVLSVIVILAAASVAFVLFTHASASPWVGIVKEYDCPINGYGVPANIQQGSTGNCVKMTQFILKTYAGQNNLHIDGVYGDSTTTSVRNVQTVFGTNPVNGMVGPATWQVIETVYTLGAAKKPTNGSGALGPDGPQGPPGSVVNPIKIKDSGVELYGDHPIWNSAAFGTTNGAIKVSTTLDDTLVGGGPTIPGFSYDVHIQSLDSTNNWINVTTSKSAAANGNLDTFYFDQGIGRGVVYRVEIHSAGTYVHNTVWIDPTVDPDGNGQ